MFVEVDAVRKVYEGKGGQFALPIVALDEASLGVAQGEFVALLGPSGCGKTTLLMCLAGLLGVDTGVVRFDGQTVQGPPAGVAVVFQDYSRSLLPWKNNLDNVLFGMRRLEISAPEGREWAMELLANVGLRGYEKHYPWQVSGGMQQRVAIARGLASRSRLLLLDEPLSALDLQLRKDMQVELKRLQQEAAITFIFVTHDQEEALALSDRIAVMQAGRIMQVGTPSAIYQKPQNQFVAQFIGDINVLSGVLQSGENGHVLFRPQGTTRDIPCELPDGLNPARVKLAFRPERAKLVTASEAHHLTAQIETLIYVGASTLYRCRLADGTLMTLREHNENGHSRAVGEWLCVQLPQQACLLLEA